MASVIGYQVTVASTATALEPSADQLDGAGGLGMVIRNRGTASVYLGDSSVTTSTGYELAIGEAVSLAFDKAWKYGVYAICASGTHRVDVLKAAGDSR